MAGINYLNATVEIRESFSMTNEEIRKALSFLHETYPEAGFLILHTCNRTELWVSEEDTKSLGLSAAQLLCDINDLSYKTYQKQITSLKNMSAIEYLFELASGLHSQILGDDQIISQVKRAQDAAREQKAIDSVLENLFRSAVTAAKRVKTELEIRNIDTSVSAAVVTLLKKEKVKLEGASCLILGNGEIARCTAEELLRENSEVIMTLRRHNADKVQVILPSDIQAVPYENRYLHVRNADIIISATKSVHQTLKKDDLLPVLGDKPKTLVDLAIPRDIDPEIAELPNISYHNMDSFISKQSAYRNSILETAQKMFKEPIKQFEQWYAFRKWIPTIQNISKSVADENQERLSARLSQTLPNRKLREDVLSYVRLTTEKTVSKLLYGLREELQAADLEIILPVLEHISQDFNLINND